LFVESTDYGWWYVCPDDGHGVIACFVTDVPSAQALRPAQAYNWNKLFGSTKLSKELHCRVSATCIHAAATGMATLPQKHGPRWWLLDSPASQAARSRVANTEPILRRKIEGARQLTRRSTELAQAI